MNFFKELLRRDETVTMEDVRRLLCPASLLSSGGFYPKGKKEPIATANIVMALRERFCPPVDQLSPGQLIAVALDQRDRRMSTPMKFRAHVPVRLTVYHEAEIAALERLGPQDRQAID